MSTTLLFLILSHFCIVKISRSLQSVILSQLEMEPEDLTDPDLRAAIAASLRDLHDNGASPADDSQHKVVDLTAESDDDEVIPIFQSPNQLLGLIQMLMRMKI